MKLPPLQITTQLGKRSEFVFCHILTHGDGPGVICRRGVSQITVLLPPTEFFDFLIVAARFSIPYRLSFGEKRAIASIFRIDIQLARSDRPAHYGVVQLHFI